MNSPRTDHSIWPGITADDPIALRSWLSALGFEEGVLVEEEGLVRHSEMLWPEGGRVMISSARPDNPNFTTAVGGTKLYIVTDEPDAVYSRVESVGATVTHPMEEAHYGSRGFSIIDPEGNSWSFGTYAG